MPAVRRPEISSVICSSDVLAVPYVCVCVCAYVRKCVCPPSLYVPPDQLRLQSWKCCEISDNPGLGEEGFGFSTGAEGSPGVGNGWGILLLLLLPSSLRPNLYLSWRTLLCLNLRSKCLSHVYIILDWDSMCKFDIRILKFHDVMGMYLRSKKKAQTVVGDISSSIY